MALAKNLQPKKISRFKLPKLNRKKLYFLAPVVLAFLIFAGYNLYKVIPLKNQKMEIKYETGDRPLPQVTPIWVNADGGLYMRERPEPKSKILILIPSGTKLDATEKQDNWYKVTYMEKTGWVNSQYITTQAPAQEPTKNWNTYTDKTYSFSVRYPKDWVYLDYGENPATNSKSYLAFGAQLPPQLDPNNLPPLILRVSTQTPEAVNNSYKQRGGVVEAATVSKLAASKYTYNSSSGVQMTAYVVARGATTFIIEETGGYSDELAQFVATINL